MKQYVILLCDHDYTNGLATLKSKEMDYNKTKPSETYPINEFDNANLKELQRKNGLWIR